MRLKTIDIALFSYGGVVPQTVDSLIAEIFNSTINERIPVKYSRVSDDALISRSRSRAATNFLNRPGSQVLLMVDHDLEWRAGDGLATARKAWETGGIVGGLYAMRRNRLPDGTLTQGHASRPSVADVELQIGGERLIPAEFVATGFMAIPRGALEKMLKTLGPDAETEPNTDYRIRECVGRSVEESFWDFFRCFTVASTAFPGKNEYLSEDYSICIRARACGIPIAIYERPVLTHHGMHGWRVQDG